jgi:hypothetical protein
VKRLTDGVWDPAAKYFIAWEAQYACLAAEDYHRTAKAKDVKEIKRPYGWILAWR